MTAATPTLTLVRGAEYGQEIQGFIFPIRIVTSNAETLDQAIEQLNQAEQLVHVWNTHDALVKALQGMIAATDHWHDSDGEFLKSGERNPRFAARAALTAAGAA
ncbi:hypothetical protein [Herbaspirillum autotrophicum]|uniref:hypothetical protein n=1 Tax=Herbaspirillum autotrophicum TaxID=180195 RepID=UPI00067A88FF|nr:hypothetical protein [Herbaspirillum autotrophicum]